MTPLPIFPTSAPGGQYLVVLTNASNGLYLGPLEPLKTRTRCTFVGGGIVCKPTDLVTYQVLLGPFPSKSEAQDALCENITERRVFPQALGLRGRWQKTNSWYGLWGPDVTIACPQS